MEHKFISHRPLQFHNGILIVKFNDYNVAFYDLAGINLKTGEILWRRPNEFYSNFVIANDLLYVISKESKIVILAPQTGETVGFAELLPREVDTTYWISAIAVNESMLYIHFFDSGELIAFERINN